MAGEVASLRHDNAVVLLETKLKAWMVQQPEWLTIVELPRQQRRAAMRELANRLYTIPIMDGVNTIPRVVRRKAKKELAKAALGAELTQQLQAALLEAAALVPGDDALPDQEPGGVAELGFIEADETTPEEPALD